MLHNVDSPEERRGHGGHRDLAEVGANADWGKGSAVVTIVLHLE